jgi:uncharacterized membrane protein
MQRGKILAEPQGASETFAVHIDETISSIAKLRAEHQENATPMQRRVDRVAKFLGRPLFIASISLVVAGWVGLNLLSAALGFRAVDPPPFPWLSEAVSLVSLYMVVLILIAQEREDQLGRQREMLILELAILSEQKIAKVIQLLEESRRDDPNIRNRRDPEAETMGQAADTRSVLDAIVKKPADGPA